MKTFMFFLHLLIERVLKEYDVYTLQGYSITTQCPTQRANASPLQTIRPFYPTPPPPCFVVRVGRDKYTFQAELQVNRSIESVHRKVRVYTSQAEMWGTLEMWEVCTFVPVKLLFLRLPLIFSKGVFTGQSLKLLGVFF